MVFFHQTKDTARRLQSRNCWICLCGRCVCRQQATGKGDWEPFTRSFNDFCEQVNSVAIVEDTGGFSGIIVAAHELGHLYVLPRQHSPYSNLFSFSCSFLSAQTWGCAWRVSPSLLPRGSRRSEVQLGGRIHHERPEAHQQGLQVVPLHSQAVSALSQVSRCFSRGQL